MKRFFSSFPGFKDVISQKMLAVQTSIVFEFEPTYLNPRQYGLSNLFPARVCFQVPMNRFEEKDEELCRMRI